MKFKRKEIQAVSFESMPKPDTGWKVILLIGATIIGLMIVSGVLV